MIIIADASLPSPSWGIKIRQLERSMLLCSLRVNVLFEQSLERKNCCGEGLIVVSLFVEPLPLIASSCFTSRRYEGVVRKMFLRKKLIFVFR